jgi:SAM-dependent methyltransferase
VTAVDFSAQMIAKALRHHPELDFQVTNLEELPFPHDAFDVAVVNYCAHHLARPDRAFGEVRRVLAPGGRLAVVHPIQSRQPSWGSFADADVLPPETVPGGLLLDVAEPEPYIKLLQDCGYSEVVCEIKTKPVSVPRLEQLLEGGWVLTGLHEQSTEVRSRIEAVVRERSAGYRNADDSYTFQDHVLVARGVA